MVSISKLMPEAPVDGDLVDLYPDLHVFRS